MFCHYLFLYQSFADNLVALVWSQSVRMGWVEGWRQGYCCHCCCSPGLLGNGEDDLFFPQCCSLFCFVHCGQHFGRTKFCGTRKLDRCTARFFFLFLGWDGQTDVWTWRFPGLGKEFFGLTLRDTIAWKKEGERDNKWVRRRGKGGYGLTMNSQNGCPPLMLTRETLWIYQPDEEKGERFSHRSSLGLSWLPHGDHPFTLPPTYSPSHIHTFTHIHRHTVSPVNVNSLGFSVDCTIYPHSQICFQQIPSFRCYLKVLRKKKKFFFFCTVNIYWSCFLFVISGVHILV